MPIFDFVCTSCGVVEEVWKIKSTDQDPDKCSCCGAELSMRKILGASTFQLKGQGWAKDNYSNKTSADPQKSADAPT